MKKTIRLWVTGFWRQFVLEDFWIYQLLADRYVVDLTRASPDFVLCSVYGAPYGVPFDYCEYDCPRVLYSGENYTPDFNLVDYAIGQDEISFNDRYIRAPICIQLNTLKDMDRERKHVPANLLAEKRYFCNFLTSHSGERGVREGFFSFLTRTYKRVESAGSFMNNMPDGRVVSRQDKTDFQRKCKFTLCFESTSQSGFCTEKLPDAFRAYTIPIYYGDPRVSTIFNERAFVDCSKYGSYDEIVNVIRTLDTDDEQYMAMLREPVLNDATLPETTHERVRQFLYRVFDQEPTEAYRRSRAFYARRYEDYARLFRQVCLRNESLRSRAQRLGRLRSCLVRKLHMTRASDAVKQLLGR